MSEHDDRPHGPATARRNIEGTAAPRLKRLESQRPRFSHVAAPPVKRIVRIVNGLKQLAKYSAGQRDVRHLDNKRVKSITRRYPGRANEHQEYRSRYLVMPVRSSDLVYQAADKSDKPRSEGITPGAPGAGTRSGGRRAGNDPAAQASAIFDIAARAMVQVKRELAGSYVAWRRIAGSRFARPEVQRAIAEIQRREAAASRLNVKQTWDQSGASVVTDKASAVPSEWRRMGAELALMHGGLRSGLALAATRRNGQRTSRGSTDPRWPDLMRAQRALLSAMESPTPSLSESHRNSAESSPPEEHRAPSPSGGRYNGIAHDSRIAAPRAGSSRLGDSAGNETGPRRRTSTGGSRVRAAAALTSRFAVAPTEPNRTFRIAPASHSGVVVNYSPTVVINGASEIPDLDRRVVEAISRHGHELAQIIDRELAMRQRSIF